MIWRGVSTARQITSPPLHAPTLVIQWWASMPGSLKGETGLAGNGVTLLLPLSDEITYAPEKPARNRRWKSVTLKE
jgi:hypothetical protein